MNIRFLTLVLICLITFQANSQVWTNYTTSEILEDSVFNYVFIDKTPVLWAVTQNQGILTYDGSNWKRFDNITISTDIKSITLDNQNAKYFVSYGSGLSVYDVSSWKFFSYFTQDISYLDTITGYYYEKNTKLLSNNINSCVLDSVNYKWLGTDYGVANISNMISGVYYYNSYNKSNGLSNDTVNSIAYQVPALPKSQWKKYKTFWFATNQCLTKMVIKPGPTPTNPDTSWYKFNSQGRWKFNKTDTSWTLESDTGIVDTIIKIVYIDANEMKWLVTKQGVVYTFNDTIFTKINTPSYISNSISNITSDKYNNIIFTSSTGVAIYTDTSDIDTSGIWQNINFTNNTLSNSISNVAVDTSGNIWFATNKGLSYWDKKSWINIRNLPVLKNNNIWATAIDKNNNKWFGTYGAGVFKYDGTNWTNYNTSNGLADSVVLSIAIDNSNNKWFGTYQKGLSRFNGSSFTNYNHYNGLSGDCVFSIKFDNSGNAWLGTGYGKGVSRLSGGSFTTYGYRNGLAFDDVRSIAIDNKGNKWFGTFGGGLSKFNNSTWQTLNEEDGLVGNYIQSVTIDKNGKKWIGTTAGLSVYNDTVFTNYFEGINVWDVEVDDDNNIWVGTWGDGVKKFDGTNWVSYNTTWHDTLNTNAFFDNRINSISIDGQGVKYFGTWSGLTILNDGGKKNYEVQQESQLVENVITNVNVYPIPVSDELTVDYNPINTDNCVVEIYDVLGKQISSEQILSSQTLLNFDNLDRGIYMLKITDGESKFIQKIVKN